jgi:serine/threonine protein kinase
MKVCLADFGFAANADERDIIAKRCGTRGYMAPEMFEEHWKIAFSAPLEDPLLATENILKTDIFSYGLLIYCMALGKNPLIAASATETCRRNARGIIETGDASRLSGDLQDLLKWSIARSPLDRCSIFEAADHTWFHADMRTLGFAGADDDLHGDSVSWAVFQQESRRRED